MSSVLFLSLFTSVALSSLASAAAPIPPAPFEIKEGDRVAFLGDVLLERENTFGYLETRMQEQFADRHFTVRNLSWAGDTPLGWARASFDGPAKGLERLKEAVAMVKPTVVFLGYGMASSLQELTDRSGDPTLNPDPARYGREAMSADRFKKELAQLMEAIEATVPGAKVRFVLLSPISRQSRPGVSPAPSGELAHAKLLRAYGQAVEQLAQEKNARFVDSPKLLSARPAPQLPLTENGIHLSAAGWSLFADAVSRDLGWTVSKAPSDSLRKAILEKDELFFHRFRPENATYLFGFRRGEQGRNAVEIPRFDPLIERAELAIDQLKRLRSAGNQAPAPAPGADAAKDKTAPVAGQPIIPALPNFQVADGYEISLWAQNPLLEKPTQMNWDARGRLWVCSSSLYPQIEPGQEANDKILILEDTDRNGTADKSTVFAEGLLIPTAVIPDLGPDGQGGCYVGQSTELLHFRDTDGDGQADEKRVVFSGFGTEDTHHLIHTLKWGPDGRLYFNQSIYIHSHLETPFGMVRLNSGGIFAYDPNTGRVEVVSKGGCNPWGHVWDQAGQSVMTDGAGAQGISWLIRGAQFFTYENSRRLLSSISPGSYPKFASLALIHSPHFPADWQGNALTNDFRAHRIVRFKIEDLSTGPDPKSGYVTKEQPDLVRTNDQSFRPIDLQLGPDGTLYVADWSNPVINHGEVDFRDPRRDKHMGRIWRISKKGEPIQKWEPLVGLGEPALRAKLKSPSSWEQQQARISLRPSGTTASNRPLEAPLPAQAIGLGDPATVQKRALDAAPRVRVTAMRALACLPTIESVNAVLEAALNAPTDDLYYEYAAWLSINDLAPIWTAALASGDWKPDSAARVKQLEWGLKAIDPALASGVLSSLLSQGKLPLDGTGSWLELIGQAGSPKELRALLDQVAKAKLPAEAEVRALAALAEAARLRGAIPEGDLKAAVRSFASPSAASAARTAVGLRLVGLWKIKDAQDLVASAAADLKAAPEVRNAAFEALRNLGDAPSLTSLTGADRPIEVRRGALVALTQLKLAEGIKVSAEVLPAISDEAAALETWRALVAIKGAPEALAASLPKNLSKSGAAAGLRAAREAGKPGASLLAALAPLAGVSAAEAKAPANYKAMAAAVKQSGDPALGELLYRRASLGCTTCHAIGGAGGKVGPDMTSIGASAPMDYLIESVLQPALKVKEGYNAVTLALKDGTQVSGIQARETAQEIFLRDVAGHEQSIAKGQVTGTTNIGSLMPAGLLQQLSDRERLHVFAFLGELGKPGPYDASKGTVARVWRLFPGAHAEKVIAAGAALETGIPGYTLVDGRFMRELLAASAPLAASGGDTLIAVAQFQSTGKTRLKLTGVRKAWLDGKELVLTEEMAPELPGGVHSLAAQIELKNLPEFLQAESPDARFLGN